jgi:hypothetical protein
LLYIAVAVSLLILLQWTYRLPRDLTRETPEAALFSNSSPGADKAISAQLWADRNKTRPDRTISVRLDLRDTNSLPVSNLRLLAVQVPGFQIVGPTPTLPISLPAFGSTAQVLSLQPTTDQGRFRVTVAYAWTNDKGGDSRDVVSIGPIEIGTEEQQRRIAFVRRVTSLFKDLTLPVVLAALGLWFQKRQSERDELLKKQEIERDEKFKDHQEERDRRQEVWGSILPRFHELCECHYLPIVRSLRLVIQGSQETDWDEAKASEYLFYVLALLRRMKYLRDEKGQIFFNNRTAEHVVGVAWRLFVMRVTAEFTSVKYDAALRLLEPKDSYLDFLEKAQARASRDLIFKDLVPKLQDWIAREKSGKPGNDFVKYIQVLKVLREAFYFEANRPFDEYWYGEKPAFNLEVGILGGLPAEPAESAQELNAVVAKYIDETQSYLAKS